uniref:G-protein coupled receptors family 1 profile domain-containing protein n=1 Tax=Romanomermis culicivorax TaxID=13658 RepID=A0A915I754_ROMCU
MNSSNISQLDDDIPNRLFSDYVQILILMTIFVPGICMNFYTFLKIYRRYKITESRIMLLNLQLNVTNSKILIFFVFTRICWLATYKWMGGWFLCKAVKFGQALSFMSSSNIVVCIGSDRLLSLLYPLQVKPKANKR